MRCVENNAARVLQHLGSLKDSFWFKVLEVSGVIDVSADPTDIFTTSETPFAEALSTQVEAL